MLSFLRESGFDDLPAEKNAASQTSGDDSQGASGQDYIEVSTNSNRVKRSTTVLVVLLVAGLACIWYMVKRTSPQSAGAATADANTADVELAIARITGAKSEMFGRMDDLVGKFNEFSNVPQVKVDELVKNPFELEEFLSNLNVTSDTVEIIQVDHLALMRKKAQKQADEFNLLTIMQSDGKNSCMIDNRFFYEGDSVGDFTITQIKGNFVRLLWNAKDAAIDSAGGSEKVEITLKLAEE